MPIPFDDSLARLDSDLTLNSLADEFVLAIQNASALSPALSIALANCIGDKFVGADIEQVILGAQALSAKDLVYLSSGLTSGPVALSYAQLMAGGIANADGSVSYPAVATATAATPTFSVAAGSYGPSQSVELASTTPGAAIYYTVNGTTPTTSSTLYSGAITVSSSETVKAIAVKSGFINSAVASAAYVINGQVATPTFDPVAGAYVGTQMVTLASATAGATFYYTEDGSTPTTASTLYTGPISVAVSETIKVLAVKADYVDSAIASAAYVIS